MGKEDKRWFNTENKNWATRIQLAYIRVILFAFVDKRYIW